MRVISGCRARLARVRISSPVRDWTTSTSPTRPLGQRTPPSARQNPRAKIVLWAHNGHVSRSTMAMGSHLTKTFGKDYVSIGFATREGRRTRDSLDDCPVGEFLHRLHLEGATGTCRE